MALTRREQRAINAFTNCVRSGEYTEDYAVTLLEDDSRFGWMSDAGRDVLRGFLHYAAISSVVTSNAHNVDADDPDDAGEPADLNDTAE